MKKALTAPTDERRRRARRYRGGDRHAVFHVQDRDEHRRSVSVLATERSKSPAVSGMIRPSVRTTMIEIGAEHRGIGRPGEHGRRDETEERRSAPPRRRAARTVRRPLLDVDGRAGVRPCVRADPRRRCSFASSAAMRCLVGEVDVVGIAGHRAALSSAVNPAASNSSLRAAPRRAPRPMRRSAMRVIEW